MSESIGQQLQHARQARSLTLEQVASATHVRVHYLQALEDGDLSRVPSLVQARGFLRIYAGYLGLEIESLLGDLDDMAPASPATPISSDPLAARLPDASTEPLAGPAAASAAFTEIGEKLRKQREVLGLSLEDIERHTHLRIFYLKALEAGDLDRLPSPVQGRGMLSNYAEFLGMNPEPLLLRFADGLQASLMERQATTQPRRPRAEQRPFRPPSLLRRFFSAELLVGVALVAVLVGFALWAAVRITALQAEQQPAPTAPPIAAILLATPPASPSPSSPPPTPTVPPALAQPTEGAAQPALPPPAGAEAVQVYVTVRQRAWVRVLVDGEVVFDGRVIPGSAYQYSGEEKVEILTGNGAALQVFYNQNDLGIIGLYGEVVHRVYTLQGIQTPTPTTTMTATNTTRPTRTPRVTATP